MNVMEPWKEVQRKTAKTKTVADHFLRAPISPTACQREQFVTDVEDIVADINRCKEDGKWTRASKKEVCQYYNRPCPYAELCKYGEDERIIANSYGKKEDQDFSDAIVIEEEVSL